jgi:hypothetical protein
VIAFLCGFLLVLLWTWIVIRRFQAGAPDDEELGLARWIMAERIWRRITLRTDKNRRT